MSKMLKFWAHDGGFVIAHLKDVIFTDALSLSLKASFKCYKWTGYAETASRIPFSHVFSHVSTEYSMYRNSISPEEMFGLE